MSSNNSEVKTTHTIGREPNSASLHARPRTAEETEVIDHIEDRPKEAKWQDTEHITKASENDAKGVIGEPQIKKQQQQ
ncbi:hypothetical protein INT43_000145 [Umbelopsis isabellina]|uniref:Uncharacterized protein n=1 Tax=Mortierella isabellina TaxID=91625 RepID=A0A8H7PF92_MORIS|nr:hypothetical protein INT43_000145 [Umbelopsis isabellina]